jgi:hypothetical protein
MTCRVGTLASTPRPDEGARGKDQGSDSRLRARI